MAGIEKIVCLIEDEPMIQETYALKLRERGYQVVLASDGAQGLEKMKQKRPHIALIDINMPVMDGLELMEKMADDAELSKVPVVLLTNFDDSKLVRKAGKLQARFYLIKALFTPTKVADIVDEVLVNSPL
jgi:CheY-like chemotaxis protein